MVYKLNNIIQTGTKFNHKVDNKQIAQKNDKFEKSLEKVISDDKKRNQRNQKINKKNKTDLNFKYKETKQNQNIFTPFTEKNLPIIPKSTHSINDIEKNNTISDILNNILHSNYEFETNNTNQFIPQMLNEVLDSEIPQEEKTEIIEAKLQIINEFINAIRSGFNNNRNQVINKANINNNNNLTNIENKALPIQNNFNDNTLELEEEENSDEINNKTNEKLKTQEAENLINKVSNEFIKKPEKSDVKMNLNLPTTDSKKNNENIQQRVENNAENSDNEPKKSGNKIQFSNKSNSEMGEKSLLNDLVKEQIVEITNTSKNLNHTSSKIVTTYNQFGQIRIQEFAQTTFQLIKSTPENTTSTANLVLKPESLGTLFVQISMTDNKAKINIMADTSEAIKTIEQQIGALKEKLSQNGIITDSIDIGLKSKDGEENLNNNTQFTKKQDKKQKEEIQEYLKSLNYFKEKENEVL